MEKVVQKVRSHSEADKSDRAHYRSLSPQERLDLLRNKKACGRPQDIADAEQLAGT